MKFANLLFFSLFCSSNLFSGIPEDWDQNQAYSSDDLVIYSGQTYIAQTEVPPGTTITSTTYWSLLTDNAPTSDPGSPPSFTPDLTSIPETEPPVEEEEEETTTVSGATLSNLSTRGFVGTGDSQMIAGFIVTGSGSTTVTIRVLGPTIADAPYNVSGTISDPSLTIVDGTGSVVTSNDNWVDFPLASEIQTAGRAPNYTSEAVVRLTVTPGNYTAIVNDTGGTSGVALVEVYDEATGGSSIELGNLSTRAFVGTGDSQMIAGFIVAGETDSTSTVTIRALGPTIAAAPYNVSGTIADPFLTLVDGTGSVVASVDNWESSSSASAISSTGRNPGNTLESAHQIDVSPGNYTAIISGAGGTTGVSLVEVYKE